MIIILCIVGVISWYASQAFEYMMWQVGHWLWKKGIRPRLNRW